MKIGALFRKILHPREDTTTIPERVDAAVQRNQEAAFEASRAVEALLVSMEKRKGETPNRTSKE